MKFLKQDDCIAYTVIKLSKYVNFLRFLFSANSLKPKEGPGTKPHLFVELFNENFSVKVRHKPAKLRYQIGFFPQVISLNLFLVSSLGI